MQGRGSAAPPAPGSGGYFGGRPPPPQLQQMRPFGQPPPRPYLQDMAGGRGATQDMPPHGMPPPGFRMQGPPGMRPAPIPQYHGPSNQAIRPPMFPNMMPPPPELLSPPGVDRPIQGSATWNANHAGAVPMGPIPTYMPMNAKPAEQAEPEKDSLAKEEEDYKKASQEAKAWKEYKAEDGDPYYHNSTTGETVWDMPKCLEIVKKRAKRKPVPINWKPITGTIWMKVETDDARTYYHNTKTNETMWEVPKEVTEVWEKEKEEKEKALREQELMQEKRKEMQEELIEKSREAEKLAKEKEAREKELKDSLKPKQVVEDEYGDITKDERVEIFISLLKEKDIGSTSRWDRIQLKIRSDRRFRALATQTERRAVFERYVKSKANSDKSEKEQKHNKAKTAFMDLLDQAKKDGTLRYCIREQRRGRLPMDTITKEFRDDPRLNGVNAALLTLKEKESILEKKLEEYKEEEAQAKRGKEGDLFDLLREKGVTSSDENEWESVLEKIKEHDAFRKLYREGMKEWEKIKSDIRQEEERKLDRKYRKRDRKSRDERSHRRGRDQKRSRRDYSDDEEEDMEPYHEMKDKIEENLKEMGERRALDYVRVFFKKYIFEARQEEARKSEEESALSNKETEAVKKRESEIAKARARKQSANVREAESLFKSLLAERIRDSSLTWEESYPILEKDPLKRAQSEVLSTENMENIFQKHVKELLERDETDFNNLLKQILGSKEALVTKEKEKLQKLAEESKSEKLDWKELCKKKTEMVRFFVEESDFDDPWESYEVAKRDMRLDPRYGKIGRSKREEMYNEYIKECLGHRPVADIYHEEEGHEYDDYDHKPKKSRT